MKPKSDKTLVQDALHEMRAFLRNTNLSFVEFLEMAAKKRDVAIDVHNLASKFREVDTKYRMPTWLRNFINKDMPKMRRTPGISLFTAQVGAPAKQVPQPRVLPDLTKSSR